MPNKRGGGLCLGGKIAPIFFNTMEDAGALPIEVDVSNLNMGAVIDVYPYNGEVRNHETEMCIRYSYNTTLKEQRFRESGVTRAVIAKEGNVLNFIRLIYFHDI